jgi:Tol biopolymer transport system component
LGATELDWQRVAQEDQYISTFRLSPDDRRLAFARADAAGYPHLWQLGLDRPVPIQLTFALRAETFPLWSPDGRQLVFSSDQSGVFQIYQKSADGTGQENVLTAGRNGKFPTDWSGDGQYVMYSESDPGTGTHLWAVKLVGDRKPILISAGRPSEFNGRFSPNGKWIAYDSNETGRSEIYVQTVPWTTATPGAKWPISTEGGTRPVWSGDGAELFYVAPNGKMMVAAIPSRGGGDQERRAPAALFRGVSLLRRHARRPAVPGS